jgi:hypothetical protein
MSPRQVCMWPQLSIKELLCNQEPHSPVWLRPELLSPMLKNCSMSGRTPRRRKLRMCRPRRPHPGHLLPSPSFHPSRKSVPTGHGEAIHVVQEVDVAQHGHYESRTARRQTRDALQPLLVRDLRLRGLRDPHGTWQSRSAGHRPVIRVIRLAEEGRRVGSGHGPR